MAKTHPVVTAIRKELAAAADPKYRESIRRFFKEAIQAYGARSADVGRISREHFKPVRALPRREVFDICEQLHRGGKFEDHAIAFRWAERLARQFEPSDFGMFERWLGQYVSNWAACDALCGGPLGEFLTRFPQFLPRVRKWAGSPDRWRRRAAAVAHIIPNRNGVGTDSAYKVAEALLEDPDDMVQKGYGWMLKELANKRPREVLEFVMARKGRMPRTALRYAIEKMPAAWKKRAMARN